MESILIFALLATLTGTVWGLPVTFTDPYCGGGATPSPATCNPSPDVIGERLRFDIESLRISGSGSNFSVTILTNYENPTLTSFTSTSGSLNIGDVLFSSGASRWALIVNEHDDLSTGYLYAVTNFLTAHQVLNANPYNYRPDAQVWADSSNAALVGTGTRNVSTVAGTVAERSITINFTAPNELSELLNNGGLNVSFAAATCGNDLIQGSIPAGQVPEPVSMTLIGGGLAAFGVLRRRRRAS